MSVPRIEALLVSLIVLIAAAVALATAYAPPIPRQSQTGMAQEAPRETRAAPTVTPERQSGDVLPDNAASIIVDVGGQWIVWVETNGLIALSILSSVAFLMLAIVAVRRRQHKVGSPRCGHLATDAAGVEASPFRGGFVGWVWVVCALERSGFLHPPRPPLPRREKGELERPDASNGQFNETAYREKSTLVSAAPPCGQPEGQHPVPAQKWSVPLQQWGTVAQRHAQVWTGALRRMATLQGIGRRMQRWKGVLLRFGRPALFLGNPIPENQRDEAEKAPKCGNHDAPPNDAPSTGGEEGQPDVLATVDHLVASEQSITQPDPNTIKDHQSRMTDSAAAAVAAILDVYEQQGLARSMVTFAEAGIERQRAQVRLTVAAHPDEFETLATLPEQIETRLTGSKAQWQRTTPAHPTLTITLRGPVPAIHSSHLLLPVARHQWNSRLPAFHRGASAVSFLPLHTWRHVGFYGGKAIESASSALIDLLYAEAPDTLAVTIIDQGQVSALCKETPHLVALPGAAAESLMALGRAVRSFPRAGAAMRALLIVLVEPDALLRRAHSDLVARLLRHPDAPVYSVLAQTHVPDASQRQHTLFPAVITGGGYGRSHGAGDSPPAGVVRILAPHVRLERQCHVYDAAHLAALSALLRVSSIAPLSPTVWDAIGTS